jgi:hypothetical protein
LFDFGDDSNDNAQQELALVPSPLFEEWLRDPEPNYFSVDDPANEFFDVGKGDIDLGELVLESDDGGVGSDCSACENKAHDMMHAGDEMKQVVAANGASFFLAPATGAHQTSFTTVCSSQTLLCGHLPMPQLSREIMATAFATDADKAMGNIKGLVKITEEALPLQHAAPNSLPPATCGSHHVDLLPSFNRKLAESSHSSVGAGGGKQKAALNTRQQPAAKKQRQRKPRKDRAISQPQLQNMQRFARTTRENNIHQVKGAGLNGERSSFLPTHGPQVSPVPAAISAGHSGNASGDGGCVALESASRNRRECFENQERDRNSFAVVAGTKRLRCDSGHLSTPQLSMENTNGSDEAPLPCAQKEAVGNSNLHYINDTPFDDEVRKMAANGALSADLVPNARESKLHSFTTAAAAPSQIVVPKSSLAQAPMFLRCQNFLLKEHEPLTPKQKAKHSNWPNKKKKRMRTGPPRVNPNRQRAALEKTKWRQNGRFGRTPTCACALPCDTP